MIIRFIATVTMLCLLTACDTTWSLEQLRATELTGDDYQKALAANYRDYADEEAKQYDWAISSHFAEKGLAVAAGEDVTPEDPEQWQIPEESRADFSEMRTKLIAAIAANRSTQPEMLASAMLAYDRWVTLTHQGADAQVIATERSSLDAILTKLSEVHTAVTSEPPPTTTTPPESTSTVFYFPFDSDRLGDSAQAALAELVRHIQSAGDVTVNINGHADRAGTEEYNMDLSQRRSRYVLKSLEAEGIPEKMMNYFAFGESDPAVPTEDGVREPRNRRVEIYIE